MFIDATTLTVYRTNEELQQNRFPKTTLPSVGLVEYLATQNVHPVVSTDRPQATFFQNVVEVAPIKEGATWKQAWRVENRSRTDAELSDEIERVYALKHAAAQAEKVRVRDGGLIHNGVMFVTDAQAQAAYQRFFVKLARDPGASIPNWRANDDVKVTMDGALFTALMAAWEQHEQRCFTWQDTVDAQLLAAKAARDLAALLAVPVVMS